MLHSLFPNWFKLRLPRVTLLGVDDNLENITKAARISCENIKFGAVKLLSHQNGSIPVIGSKEAYSHFIMRDVWKYFDTEYVLIIQYDGYVLNHKAWTDEFYCDYIGATWWYEDGMNNGNGGFSLRSRKLMQLVATDPHIVETHPEDLHIGRTYRPYLESKGIRFASLDLCEKFSIENHMRDDKTWRGQFGFHSDRVIIPEEKRLK